MLVKRNTDGKLQFTQVAKNLTAIATIISIVAGGLYFMEDRYYKVTAAEQMKSSIEADAVKTFQMQQQLLETKQESIKKELDTKQKALEQKYDLDKLSDLKDHKILLQKELSRNTNNELLKERLEVIITKIEKLENKVYGE